MKLVEFELVAVIHDMLSQSRNYYLERWSKRQALAVQSPLRAVVDGGIASEEVVGVTYAEIFQYRQVCVAIRRASTMVLETDYVA